MWSKVSPSVLCVLVLVGLIFTVIILTSIIRRLCGVRYSVVYRLLPIRVGFIGCRNFWLRDYNRGRAAVTCRVLGTNTDDHIGVPSRLKKMGDYIKFSFTSPPTFYEKGNVWHLMMTWFLKTSWLPKWIVPLKLQSNFYHSWFFTWNLRLYLIFLILEGKKGLKNYLGFSVGGF